MPGAKLHDHHHPHPRRRQIRISSQGRTTTTTRRTEPIDLLKRNQEHQDHHHGSRKYQLDHPTVGCRDDSTQETRQTTTTTAIIQQVPQTTLIELIRIEAPIGNQPDLFPLLLINSEETIEFKTDRHQTKLTSKPFKT